MMDSESLITSLEFVDANGLEQRQELQEHVVHVIVEGLVHAHPHHPFGALHGEWRIGGDFAAERGATACRRGRCSWSRPANSGRISFPNSSRLSITCSWRFLPAALDRMTVSTPTS